MPIRRLTLTLFLTALMPGAALAAIIGNDVGAYFQAIVGAPTAALAIFFAGMVLVIAIAWSAWVARAQFVNFVQGRISMLMFFGSLLVTLAIVLFIWMYASA